MISPSFIAFTVKTLEMYYDFPADYELRSAKYAVFIVFYNEISLLTGLGSSIIFILVISTHNKLSMSGFLTDLNDQIFCCGELYGSETFIL